LSPSQPGADVRPGRQGRDNPERIPVRRRFCLFVLAAALPVGCGVPDPETPADSYELDLSLPEGSRTGGAIIFIVDGINAEIFEQMLDAGQLPGFKKYFADRGLYVRRAACSLPGVTLANLTSIATGRFPGHHGVTGINWFDRNQLIWRDYATIAQKNTLDCDYQAPTIYEQFPDRTTFSVFFQPHRGATKFIENWTSAGPMFYFRWYERVDRLTLYRMNIVAHVARTRREWPAITCIYLLSPDFRGYEAGASSRSYRDALRHSDFQISRVLGDLDRAGLLEKTHLALVSDHGMVDVKTHFVLDDFLREQLGLCLPDRQLWENTPFEDRQDFYRRFECVTYGSGDRYWAISLRKPIRDQAGRFLRYGDWPTRPDPADLRSFPVRGRTIDLPAILARRREIDVVAYASGPDTVRIRNAVGEVEFTQPGGPGKPIGYRVIDGTDPLGYASVLPDGVQAGAARLADRRWLEVTAESDYPDLPSQMLAYFRARRAGDLCVLAAAGYDFRDEHAGGHGGMLPGEVFVPLILAGPGIPKAKRIDYGRSVDLFPTVLQALGRPLPDGLDGVGLLGR
jgi:hypothetical protein